MTSPLILKNSVLCYFMPELHNIICYSLPELDKPAPATELYDNAVKNYGLRVEFDQFTKARLGFKRSDLWLDGKMQEVFMQGGDNA